MRHNNRKIDQLRTLHIEPNYAKYAEGSCLISIGNTKVLCTASYDKKVPLFLRNQGSGWVTAEYSLLPRSTVTRCAREVKQGKQSPRTVEIQRLISRALRAALNLQMLPECQIIVDCDVIQADGGTRTASIIGGYVALNLAINNLMKQNILLRDPRLEQIGAISCGIVKGLPMIDLDYAEDSNAAVDANIIFNKRGQIVDIQATAEKGSFSKAELDSMIQLVEKNINFIFEAQNKALSQNA